jgi:hypothetical protein
VSSVRVVRFTVTLPGFSNLVYEGNANSSITAIDGTVTGFQGGAQPFTLNRR